MKVKVLKTFSDAKAGVTRYAGDEFECSRERFAYIVSKLDGYIEEVEQEKPQKQTVEE